MVIILTIIAIIFTFYAPLYLRKRADTIKPTKNMFEEFVENDHGYPWSIEQERKSSYKRALEKKVNSV